MAHLPPLLLARLDEYEAVLLASIIGAAVLAFVLVFLIHSVKRIRETRETEQTKREIAAYVAEGSISADDAVKILAATSTDDPASMIADGVAWGVVSPAKAERLIRTLRDKGAPADAGAGPTKHARVEA